MKQIALFVGRSGSGKTTVANYLSQHYGLTQVESYTTRQPRYRGEHGHVFVSDEEFNRLSNFVAYTEFDGNRYAATTEQIQQNDIYVIDVDGVEYFKEVYRGDKTPVIFLFCVAEDERRRRMLTRGDSPESVDQRIRNDNVMFRDSVDRLSHVGTVRLIQNSDVAQAAKEVLEALKEGSDYDEN